MNKNNKGVSFLVIVCQVRENYFLHLLQSITVREITLCFGGGGGQPFQEHFWFCFRLRLSPEHGVSKKNLCVFEKSENI